jgi:hypothetical protein
MSAPKTKIKYPLVLVVWQDISQSDVNWRSVDDALEWADSDNSIVRQVGFQLDNTEDHIVITESIVNDAELVGSVTKIPKPTVIEIIEIPYT